MPLIQRKRSYVRFQPDMLVGVRRGKLVVLEHWRDGKSSKGQALHYWLCRCDCGKEVVVEHQRLTRVQQSCGCSRWENNPCNFRHGMSHTYVWRCWHSMLCRGKRKTGRYASVRVCDRWKQSFVNFLADMGEPPTTRHTLDRIDGRGHYEPANCRWATPTQQARNRKTARLIRWRGETKCLSDWADEIGLRPGTLFARLYEYDWPVELALTTPRQTGNHSVFKECYATG